jgi:hypothetical protein
MVLFEAEVDGSKIVIKESELETERDRIINQMLQAKAETIVIQ